MKHATETSPISRRLSTTLATSFFAFSVVVLLLYAGVETFSDFRIQEKLVSGKQRLIAQDAAKTVSNFIQENFSILETATWLSDMDAASKAKQMRILQSLLGFRSSFRHLVLLDTQNRISAQASRLSKDALKQFTDRFKNLMSIQDHQPNRRISSVYIDSVTNEPMVAMAVSITNVFGDYKGTLIAELNLKSMWDIVDQLKVGETGYMYVSDRKGNLIAFQDTARVLKGENVSHVKVVQDFIQNHDASLPNTVALYRGILGSTVVGTYTPLKKPDWAVVTEMPWKEAYRETFQDMGASVGITLALAVLAGIFGMFMAKHLAAPVINLTETATRIAAGERDLQATIEGPKEVARLAEAFNSMTAQLRQSLKEVEQRFAELKRTEEAFRLSEERLRLALEGASDGIWDWNLKTEEVYFSPSYYTMMGYEPDEFPPSYESWRQLLHPEDAKAAEQAVRHAVEECALFAVEFRFRAKNGKWRWILGRGKVVETDKEGNAVRVAGSHTDITERKQAGDALRKEKLFSDTLIDSMPGVFYVFDEHGKFVRWNKRFETTTGYYAEEIRQMKPTDFFSGEEKDYIARKIQAAFTNGEAEVEAGFTTRGGRKIPHFFTGLRILIGDKPHVLGVGLDISDRKRAESQSARLQVLLQSVILQSPVPMVLALPDGTVEMFNDSCRTALGLEDKLYFQPGANLFTLEASWKDYDTQGNYIPLSESPLAQALQGKTTRRREMKVVRKDGTERWILVDAVPIHDENGEVTAGFLIFPDITERKQAEEVLEKRIVALTQPLDAAEGIAFEDLFSVSEIQRLQDLYAEAFGVAALITRPDGTPITRPSNFSELCGEIIRKTPKGAKNCNISDAMIGRHNPSGPNIQPCLSAGLCNAGASITVGGQHVANWLIGQVRNETQKEEEIMAYAREIGVDETTFRAAYRNVPAMSQEQFERVAHVLFELANQISTTAYQNVQQARFITERKKAEEALRQANLVVENSPVILFRWKAEEGWPVALVSQNVIQIGYTPEELLDGSVPFSAIIHPEDIERIGRELRTFTANGVDRFQQEYRIITKDGQVRWVDDRTAVEKDSEGRITHFQGIVVDITERKLAESALRKYESIVSASQDLMALINTDYVYEAVNESFLKGYNKPREEIVGRTVSQVLGEDVFKEKIQFRLDRTFTGQAVHHQDIFDIPSLGRRNLDVTLFPMTDEEGRVEGVVLNARDITETRKLEEQLIQSQKIESVGTLAGGVAHEINNPINGIMNYAQLILDRMEAEDPGREFAQEILHETQRVADIVRNLLTFARHEKHSHSPAHFSDIITSVLSLIQTVMRRDQIDLQVELQEDLPKIKCRSQQIQQVLMNLMTNARDALNDRYPGYDPEKKLRVITKRIKKQGRNFIRTTVEDAGNGIPSGIRDRIFDPFFTTKPKETGTGLGLSISYGIVKDHGGELIVESEPERYTRFHMDLPVDNGWKLQK